MGSGSLVTVVGGAGPGGVSPAILAPALILAPSLALAPGMDVLPTARPIQAIGGTLALVSVN